MTPRLRQVAYFSAAPLLSLLIFFQSWFAWFQNDDFGWLALRFTAERKGLAYVLFHPYAQGTVRVLSERIPFYVFGSVFGLNPIPFRIAAWICWTIALILATLIGARLTRSRMAGFLAGILWAVNANLVRPLSWASDLNEVMCAALILMAFYAHLRGWRLIEWAAFLAGLASLEIAVIYPAAATLYSGLFDRKRLRGTLALWIPSAMFAAIHFFFIPKVGAEYQITLDSRIFSTFIRYLEFAFSPTELYPIYGRFERSGMAAFLLICAGCVGFIAWRAMRRDFLPLFCAAWFLLFIGPMLTLPTHMIEYAVVTPAAAIGWLGGWALAVCWQRGWIARGAAVAIAGLYVAAALAQGIYFAHWWRDRSARIESLVEGVADAHRAHPEAAFLLQGVDRELMDTGFDDDPFVLTGATVYLVPGAERTLPMRPDRQHYVLPPRAAYTMIQNGRARVLSLTGTMVQDTTKIYEAVLRLNPEVASQNFVDAADPAYQSQLGPGWYAADHQLRWMGKEAIVKLAAPADAKRLIVTGFAPSAVVENGPVTLRFSIDGIAAGTGKITSADDRFTFELPLPPGLAGKDVEVKVEASRVLRFGADARDLGVAFGTFAIR